jgi:hypothetical protein
VVRAGVVALPGASALGGFDDLPASLRQIHAPLYNSAPDAGLSGLLGPRTAPSVPDLPV